jgi:hypothetical protein
VLFVAMLLTFVQPGALRAVVRPCAAFLTYLLLARLGWLPGFLFH